MQTNTEPRTLGELWDLPPEARALADEVTALREELERERALRESAEESLGAVADARQSVEKAKRVLAEALDLLDP